VAIDPLSVWEDELENLPKVSDTSWAANFASWYADRLIGITTDPAALVPTGFVFTFNESLFASGLLALGPTNNQVQAINDFADAWEVAMLASTVVVGPGSFIPPATPASTFGGVASTVIDPFAAAKAKLLELIGVPPTVPSAFPTKFRDATLLLTITASGVNSVSPTPGPLTAANVPLI
jgi:hypothetical protein